MSDATDDMDYENSGQQARFRKADKELWEKQKLARSDKQLIAEIEEIILNNGRSWRGLDELAKECAQDIAHIIKTQKKLLIKDVLGALLAGSETYTHYIGDGKFKAVPLDQVTAILNDMEKL